MPIAEPPTIRGLARNEPTYGAPDSIPASSRHGGADVAHEHAQERLDERIDGLDLLLEQRFRNHDAYRVDRRGGVGAARLGVDQRHLAENPPGGHFGEHAPATIALDPDLDLARIDHIGRVRLVALLDDRRSGRKSLTLKRIQRHDK